MEIKQGNLIDALLSGEVDYMFHCCNCQNNFGSGIAKEVRERIPEAYKADTDHHRAHLGNILGSFSKGGGVFNLYGQNYYGFYGDWFESHGRQLNYGAYVSALKDALESVMLTHCLAPVKLGFPYKIGSERAGGIWEEVKMITEVLANSYGYEVVWYQYNGDK